MTLPGWLLSRTGWAGRILLLFIGALAALGQAPFHIWPLSLLCFAFLFAYLSFNRERGISGFWMSFWFAFGYFMAGTFWIGSAFIERGPEFVPLMPPMILGLGALLAFFWGLAGWVSVRFGRKGWQGWLLMISVFMLAELARGHVFGGFPWNLPGYIFKAGTPLSQFASLTNIYGLTQLVFGLSACIAALMLRPRGRSAALIFLGLFIGAYGFGYVRLDQAETQFAREDATIRLVQVPFAQRDRNDPEKSVSIAQQFINLSAADGLDDVTHLIWPEGAIGGLALQNGPFMSAMQQTLTQDNETPPVWLLQTLRQQIKPDRAGIPQPHYYNSTVVISFEPDGFAAVQSYSDKKRLVPFGELIPGGGWLEALGAKTISLSLASLTPAEEKVLTDVPGLPTLSAQICYEIIFPGLTPARRKGEKTPQWILNQSNDAWFGQSVGPLQHANIAAYRAIETGLPVIRSASNGVSGQIDPYGRYYNKLHPDMQTVVDIKLLAPIPPPLKLPFPTQLLILQNLLFGVYLGLLAWRHGQWQEAPK